MKVSLNHAFNKLNMKNLTATLVAVVLLGAQLAYSQTTPPPPVPAGSPAIPASPATPPTTPLPATQQQTTEPNKDLNSQPSTPRTGNPSEDTLIRQKSMGKDSMKGMMKDKSMQKTNNSPEVDTTNKAGQPAVGKRRKKN